MGEVFTNLAFFPLHARDHGRLPRASGSTPSSGRWSSRTWPSSARSRRSTPSPPTRWGEAAATAGDLDPRPRCRPPLYCSMAYTEGVALACAVARGAAGAVRGRWVLAGAGRGRRRRSPGRPGSWWRCWSGCWRSVRPGAGHGCAAPPLGRAAERRRRRRLPRLDGDRPRLGPAAASRPSARGTAASWASGWSRRRPREIAAGLGARREGDLTARPGTRRSATWASWSPTSAAGAALARRGRPALALGRLLARGDRGAPVQRHHHLDGPLRPDGVPAASGRSATGSAEDRRRARAGRGGRRGADRCCWWPSSRCGPRRDPQHRDHRVVVGEPHAARPARAR